MKKLLSPMLARERTDTHRAVTELELLFDLVFVVAIALAAVGLHHATVEAHWTVDLIIIAICSTIVPFVLWWLYFYEEENFSSEEVKHVFL